MPRQRIRRAALHERIGISQSTDRHLRFLRTPVGPLRQDSHCVHSHDRFPVARGAGDERVVQRLEAMHQPQRMHLLIHIHRLFEGNFQRC